VKPLGHGKRLKFEKMTQLFREGTIVSSLKYLSRFGVSNVQNGLCNDLAVLLQAASRRISIEVARSMRAERVRQGLSISGVARSAGLSRQMVSYVERGMRNPTLDTLLRIACALNVDLPRLIKHASKTVRR